MANFGKDLGGDAAQAALELGYVAVGLALLAGRQLIGRARSEATEAADDTLPALIDVACGSLRRLGGFLPTDDGDRRPPAV